MTGDTNSAENTFKIDDLCEAYKAGWEAGHDDSPLTPVMEWCRDNQWSDYAEVMGYGEQARPDSCLSFSPQGGQDT